MPRKAIVEGSGTALTADGEAAVGAAAAAGSKTNVPPAPIVNRVPFGKAAGFVTYKEPVSTAVPPVYVSEPLRINRPSPLTVNDPPPLTFPDNSNEPPSVGLTSRSAANTRSAGDRMISTQNGVAHEGHVAVAGNRAGAAYGPQEDCAASPAYVTDIERAILDHIAVERHTGAAGDGDRAAWVVRDAAEHVAAPPVKAIVP